jgi:hypothetical protein
LFRFANQFEIYRRREVVGFSFHQEVATLPSDEAFNLAVSLLITQAFWPEAILVSMVQSHSSDGREDSG